MKKLYRKGTVHPSLPPIADDHLSLLPAALLTLAAALSPQDREVLAYLISSAVTTTHHTTTTTSTLPSSSSSSSSDHPPLFTCDCFRCYMSFWARWDSSPNRQLIHQIIDEFEDDQMTKIPPKPNKKDKKRRPKNGNNKKTKNKGSSNNHDPVNTNQTSDSGSHELTHESDSVQDNNNHHNNNNKVEEVNSDKGSVRSFVSFIGEKIWGVWG